MVRVLDKDREFNGIKGKLLTGFAAITGETVATAQTASMPQATFLISLKPDELSSSLSPSLKAVMAYNNDS